MDLRELGLSKNEEQAFRVLVAHGRLSASNVSRHSGVSYGKIYEVLASLEHKGLVKVIPEKTKIYVPSDPEALLTLLDEKEKRLKTLRQDVKELKKAYEENPEDAVVVVRGQHNFNKVLKEMKAGKEFSYAIKFAFQYLPDSPRKYKKSIDEGVVHKIMGKLSDENVDNIRKWQKLGQEIRMFPDFDNVALGITEHEVLLVLAKKNITMLIRDKDFVNMMKVMFENTYNLMKPIKF